jgi:hypothetical protein
MQQLPFRLSDDALAYQLSQGLVQMHSDEPGQRLRDDVKHGRVIGGRVARPKMFLDETFEIRQHFGYPTRRGGCQFLLLHFQACCPNEEDFQLRQQDFGMRQAAFPQFSAYFVEQRGRFLRVTFFQIDAGHATCIVEEYPVTANLFVIGLDAQEVGMESQAQTPEARSRDELEGLIRYQEQQRLGSKRVFSRFRTKSSLSFLDPEYGEKISALWSG